MLRSILNVLKNLIFHFFPKYWKRCYSLEGEDMVLHRYFEGQSKGFYLDIGAHHPKRYSNTYGFYKQGWRGLNIDAMPGSMKIFDQQRKRDINIEAAISVEPHTMTYYSYSDPALNSFSSELTEQRISESVYKVIDTIPILTQRLETVLNKHLQNGQVIDFMTIDVEGFDLEVLQSNDWSKYKPRIILCEILESSLAELVYHPVSTFLNSHGYHIFGKCVSTVIYRHSSEEVN